ncbi:MAG TPA: hypothetical protein VFN97_10390 [Actinospica sp.]|nr:hypothetical protein [Actinospica sp.]
MDRRPRTLRELADELLEYQRVEYIDEDRLTIVTPPSFTHGKIVESILRAVFRAQAPGDVPEGPT